MGFLTPEEIGGVAALWLGVAALLWLQATVVRGLRPGRRWSWSFLLYVVAVPVAGAAALWPVFALDPRIREVGYPSLLIVLWLGLTSVVAFQERRGRVREAAGHGTVGSIGGPLRRADWLVVLLGASMLATPRLVADAVIPRPCDDADRALAGRTPADVDRDPADWMPSRPPDTLASDGRRLDLEAIVASRVDGDAGRRALVEAGFVAAYRVRYDTPAGLVEVTAQRFHDTEGALRFDAYATGVACRFATHAFIGPRSGVGLHIRYAEGHAFGEQVAWVSGSTRILAWVGGSDPFTDHRRLEALVAAIP